MITSPEGRKSMLKLAERMVMSFCTGVGASTAHAWTTLSATGSDDVRVMTRKSMDDPGRPPGIVLSAATSFWLPVAAKRVFHLLRDENHRSEVNEVMSLLSICISSSLLQREESVLERRRLILDVILSPKKKNHINDAHFVELENRI